MNKLTARGIERHEEEATAAAIKMIEHIKQLQGEDIILLHGRAFVVYPAEAKDVERISAGIVMD